MSTEDSEVAKVLDHAMEYTTLAEALKKSIAENMSPTRYSINGIECVPLSYKAPNIIKHGSIADLKTGDTIEVRLDAYGYPTENYSGERCISIPIEGDSYDKSAKPLEQFSIKSVTPTVTPRSYALLREAATLLTSIDQLRDLMQVIEVAPNDNVLFPMKLADTEIELTLPKADILSIISRNVEELSKKLKDLGYEDIATDSKE